MTKLHEKSPCCKAKIRRFGQRRRQCSSCKKTWSVWKKKTGRKPRRPNMDSFVRYLEGDSVQLTRQANQRDIAPATYTARTRKSLELYIKKTPWPDVPQKPLVLVADAMIQTIDDYMWSIFLFLARPVDEEDGIILPPYVRLGSEHKHGGWTKAFASIPQETKDRIVAFVSDGAIEATSQAKKHGWIIQRCQFHLLFRISNYLRPPGPLSRNIPLASRVYPPVYTVLYDNDELEAEMAVQKLKELMPHIRSQGLKTTLSGFIKHYRDYRAYIYFPQYNLPVTSNSGETLVRQMRDLLSRAHGYRTMDSYQKWLEAVLKYRKTIVCKGKNQQH